MVYHRKGFLEENLFLLVFFHFLQNKFTVKYSQLQILNKNDTNQLHKC